MNSSTNIPSNSPAAAQINEALKNVAAMNNKVGGRRKTRKVKHRKQTRKNLKARKSTRRMKGSGLIDDYKDCNHLLDENHTYPSILIALKKPKRDNKPGPKKPYRFYDCTEVYDVSKGTGFVGKSCENPRLSNRFIPIKDVDIRGEANSIQELFEWCCPQYN